MTKSEQLYQLLYNRILEGSLKSGERLSAEPELAKEWQISRKTLRSALALLEKEGLIRRTPHHGTFVCDRTFHGRKRILFIEVNSDKRLEPCATALYTFAGVSRRCRELEMECDHIDIHLLADIQPFNTADYAGIILDSARISAWQETLTLLRSTGLPMIDVAGFERTPGECGFTCLIPDRKKAWIAGVEHLIRRGHRRIGFVLRIGWEQFEDRIGLTERRFWQVLEERGIALKDISVAFCNDGKEETVAPAVSSLLAVKKELRPSALFCASDGIAAYTYKVLRELNLRIPEDVAVLGFSGCLRGALLKPELSTVDFDYTRAAALAVDLLLSPRYKELPQKIYTPFEVVMRASTEPIHFEI